MSTKTSMSDESYYFSIAFCPLTKRFVITERTPTHQVQIYTINGRFVRKFGKDLLQFPRGVCVDKDGIIIVIECKVCFFISFNWFLSKLL